MIKYGVLVHAELDNLNPLRCTFRAFRRNILQDKDKLLAT